MLEGQPETFSSLCTIFFLFPAPRQHDIDCLGNTLQQGIYPADAGCLAEAGVASGVGVRPSNFYIEPGDKSLEELFAMANNGFYLTDVQGLHAGINVINGDFSLQAQGYEIVDGKLGNPVNLIVASGNIKKLLNEVVAIGNDLNFKTGNIGAPSLLVKEIAISGK